MMDTVLVTETFVSIQGEGLYTGWPCFFIRLSGCNLKCAYCDTEYAKPPGTPYRLTALVEEWRRSKVGHVLITGGEPLIQEGVYGLMAMLLQEGARVLLETNGSIELGRIPAQVLKCVDWKTPGSGMATSWVASNLRYLAMGDAIKFVICNRYDYEWSRERLLDHALHHFTNVIFSPAWERIHIRDLAEWVLSDRLPVRLGIQLHKVIWGNVRGK